MIYSVAVTTAKQTLESNALITPLKLTKGVIKNVEFYFPPGNAGLHHLRLFINDKLFVPYNNDNYIIGDSVLLSYDVNHYLNEEPFLLKIESVNFDNVYSHTAHIRIDVKSLNEITEHQEDILALSSIKDEIISLRDEITKVSIKQTTERLTSIFGRNRR